MKGPILGQTILLNGRPETVRNAIIDVGASTNKLIWFVPYVGSLHRPETIWLQYQESFFALEANELHVTGLYHEDGMSALLTRKKVLDALLQPFGFHGANNHALVSAMQGTAFG